MLCNKGGLNGKMGSIYKNDSFGKMSCLWEMWESQEIVCHSLWNINYELQILYGLLFMHSTYIVYFSCFL